MTGERVPFGLQLGKRFGDTIPFAGYGCLDLNRSSRVKKIKSVSGAREGRGRVRFKDRQKKLGKDSNRLAAKCKMLSGNSVL